MPASMNILLISTVLHALKRALHVCSSKAITHLVTCVVGHVGGKIHYMLKTSCNAHVTRVVALQCCLERTPFPLPHSPPTPLRRSSLAAAAKRPLAVSVGSARPNSQRLELVSRTAVRLVTGEPRGGDVFTSRLS